MNQTVGKIIRDCRQADEAKRPSFDAILKEFKTSRFQMTPGVDTKQVEAFVRQIERLERQLADKTSGV
jgi:uncharacterized protein (UPF0335 family)